MLKIKRNFALLMCYIIATVICATAFKGTETIYGEEYVTEHMLELYTLNYINVIQMPDDGALQQKNLTRAEFADYLAHGLKIENSQNINYFKDIDTSHWASLSLNGLATAGIISGSGESYFNPDDYITYDEAYKMLISALGYSDYAEAAGGYPYGYTKVAKELDIDVSYVDPKAVSMDEAVQLLFNTFSVGLCDYSKISTKGNNIIKEMKNSDQTIFSVYHNLHIAEGRVTAYYTGVMDGYREAEKNEVSIDDTMFYKGDDVDAKSLFTRSVDYVYEKSDDEQGTVIYMEKSNFSDKEITFNHDDIIAFNESEYLVTYDTDKNKSAVKNINKDAVIILNGRTEKKNSLKGIINEFIDDKARGTVCLRDTNADGAYDTVLIYSYKTMAVFQTNADKTVLYNRNQKGEYIDTTEYKNVSIKDINQKETTLDIKLPYVISVAGSSDKESLEIIVSNQTEKASIDTLYDDKYEIVSKGETLELDKSLYEENKSRLKPGEEIEFIRDIFGYVCLLTDKDSETPVCGYLIALAIDDTGFSNAVKAKVYTSDGNIEIYPFAESVKIDGIKYNVGTDLLKMLNSLTSKPISKISKISEYTADKQLILYTLNTKSEIKYIDTAKCNDAYEDKNNTLRKQADYSKIYYYTGNKRFGMRLYIEPGITKTFFVPNYNSLGTILDPEGNPVTDNISLYSMSGTFTGWTAYAIDAYYFGGSKLYADAVVVRNTRTFENMTTYCFKNSEESVNSDGEMITVVNALYNGKEVKIEWEDASKISDLAQGDLFLLSNDVNGKACAVRKLYDADDKCFVGFGQSDDVISIEDTRTIRDESGSGLLNIDISLAKGYVKDKDGYYISTLYENAPFGEEYSRIDDLQWRPIYVYEPDAHKDKLRIGSIDDVISAKQDGNGSFIVFSNYRTTINCILVYK